MRTAARVGFAAVVVGAVALFATCQRDQPATKSQAAEVAPADGPASQRERVRASPPQPAAQAALEHQPPAPTEPSESKATTTLHPEGVKLAVSEHLLRGRVVDTDGRPVAGAEIRLWSLWLPAELADRIVAGELAHAESAATTAADGTFALRYWEGGPRGLGVFLDRQLRWFAQGVGDDRVHEIVLASGRPVVRVRVVRESDGGPVTGTVSVRLAQSALANLPAHGDDRPYELRIGLAQGEDGMWSTAEAAAGPAVLSVAAFEPGSDATSIAESRVVVPSQGDATFEVKVPAPRTGVRVHASVVDAGTGDPIPGALFQLGDNAGINWSSDADGRVELRGVAMQPHEFRSFRASAEGYAESVAFAAISDEKQTSCDVVVRLEHAANVRCRCVTPSGESVAGALVAAWSDYDVTPIGGMRTTEDDLSTTTSATDGRVALDDLHPGTDGMPLRVRFHIEGVPVLERTYPPLVAGETRDLGDVVLAPTLTLTGTVLDADGKPVAGATVVAAPTDADDADHAAIGAAVMERGGRRAETQPDGTFALTGLSKGLWDLYAYASWESPGRLELGVDPSRGSVSLRLPRVVWLTGRVVDAKGTPVAKANVTSFRPYFGSRMSVSCLTTDEGRFGIPGYAEGTPDVEVSVKPHADAEAQMFKARPGAEGTELRLR